MTLKIGALFAGMGGLDEAVEMVIPSEVAWVSEIEKGPSKILAHHYPNAPNHGDVTKIDWTNVEPVDIITGGSPCQDLSHAGKRAGMKTGTRSGLWASMCDAIDIIRPSLVVWENVRGALSATATPGDVESCEFCVGDNDGQPSLRALGRVLGDLAELGYDAGWCGLRAADVGAPHGRYRVFIVAWPTVANPNDKGLEGPRYRGSETPPRRQGHPGEGASSGHRTEWGAYEPAIRRWERVSAREAPAPAETITGGSPRVSARFVEWMQGLPDGWVTDPAIGISRNEQLKALGNGVVPQQAAEAIRYLLTQRKAH